MLCLPNLVLYRLIFTIEVFQPIFIELGMYVKIKEICHGENIELGTIQMSQLRPF